MARRECLLLLPLFAVLTLGCGVTEPKPRRVVHQDDAPAPAAQAQPVDAAGTPRDSERLLFRDWTFEQTAVNSLGRIGAPAVTSLTQMLHDPRPELRRDAARALARIGSDAREAVGDLIAALDDPDLDVRKNAARALGEIGPAAAPAVPALMRELRNSQQTPEHPAPNRARPREPGSAAQPGPASDG